MPHKVRKMNYVSVMLYHLTGERAFRGSADSPAGFLKLTIIGRKWPIGVILTKRYDVLYN